MKIYRLTAWKALRASVPGRGNDQHIMVLAITVISIVRPRSNATKQPATKMFLSMS